MPVEVKRLVPVSALAGLAERLGLGEPKRREVWFFDLRPPALAAGGGILRLRRGEKKEELTVKLRGRALPADLAALFEGEGYKAELDAAGDDDGELRVTPATSLDLDDLPRGDETPEGGVALRDRLTKEQRALVALAVGEVDWPAVVAWGPIRSEAWKLDEATLEMWRIKGEGILEVSLRGEHAEQADVQLRALLHRWKVQAQGLPGGKTAWAMERLGGGPLSDRLPQGRA